MVRRVMVPVPDPNLLQLAIGRKQDVASLQVCLIGGGTTQSLVAGIGTLIMEIDPSVCFSRGIFRQVASRKEVGQSG